jgi:putative transcriptional regulator
LIPYLSKETATSNKNSLIFSLLSKIAMSSDRSKFNQLLVLSRLSESKESKSQISSELGMTKQGLLYHVKSLRDNGFIDDSDHITPKGYEYLYSGLMDLSRLIQSNLTILHSNISWEAIASEDLESDDRVNLYMHNGYLMASRSTLTGSTGICRIKAKKGDPVSIDRVQGMIHFDQGKIDIFTLPSMDEGGYSASDVRKRLSGILLNGRKIGVIGEQAFALLDSLKRADFEYATPASAFDSALRGISSSIFVSRSRFIFVSAELSELAKKFPQVVFSVNNI